MRRAMILLLALAGCGKPTVDNTHGTAAPTQRAEPAEPAATTSSTAAIAGTGPWVGAWTIHLQDDESCVPPQPLEVTLGPPTARRPEDAGPGGVVRAEGQTTLSYADARGAVVVDVFVLDRGAGRIEWWLEHRADTWAVSAMWSTFPPPNTPPNTFVYSAIGDCVAIDRVCACISAPTWAFTRR